jgi:predicted glycosyltransferase
MCTHDSRGLGHTSRTLAIASRLALDVPDCSILVVTDLPIIGRFKFPQNVDFVRLPGVAEPGRDRSRISGLNIARESTLKLRRRIVRSVVKSFEPDLVIVERDPGQLTNEMRDILEYVREQLPETRIVWGLPDVAGEPEAVVRDWKREGVLDLFDEVCDEIWIHGHRDLFDQETHYGLPEAVARKTVYTGYLRPHTNGASRVAAELAEGGKRPLVFLTGGGGANGYPLLDGYFRFLEKMNGRIPIQSVIVSGPMMHSDHKNEFIERAERLPHLAFHRFSKHLLDYLRHARLVVFTGGYNTHCANLAFRKKAIVSPAPSPSNERLHRARVFGELGVVDLLDPEELTPQRLGDMVMDSISNGSVFPDHEKTRKIPMEGLDRIGERIRHLAGVPAVSRAGSP